MMFNTACIIDDDPIFIFGSKILLKNNDFSNNIIICQNGREAINIIVSMLESQKPLPEIIFLDLNMPIMDGWEFLEEFAKLSNIGNVKIYILSSSIDSRDIARAKEYELVHDFIAKPLTNGKINAIVKSLEG